ncbi:serine/threonine-protein kinase [Streptomyces sp. NPDC047024]|uniref:serine/threonine protein kinase n=1 Tax=Streptomyces sp. NPDC047024 TaxID=3155476 RepID=UPI0033EBDE89
MVSFIGSDTDRLWTYDPSQRIGDDSGFGAVFQGQADDGTPVAIKKVPLPGDSQAERARERELTVSQQVAAAHVAAPLKHTLVLLDHAKSDDGALLIVMPRADESLSQALRRSDFTEQDRIDALVQVAQGLDELHGLDILHRDLKPANVLYFEGRWVLADFGMSRDVTQETASHTFKGWGTPPYMAPEVWRMESASVKTDLYALGVLGYEVIGGQRPFAGPTREDFREQHLQQPPPELASAVAPPLARLLHRMLHKQPFQRPQDARAVVEALDRAVMLLSPAQQRLAELARIATARTAQQEAEQARRVAADRAVEGKYLQARADLSSLLEDARDAALPALEELQLHGDGAQFHLSTEQGMVTFVPWPTRFADPADPLVAAGQVFVRRRDEWPSITINTPMATRANIVCELSGGRLVWYMLQFEANSILAGVPYGLGPADRPHGFSEEIFRGQRSHMRSQGAHIWQVCKEKLECETILRLFGEALTSSG